MNARKLKDDILQEMTEAMEATQEMTEAMEATQEKAQAAERALLEHLAREGVLASERDAVAARHEQLTRALVQARQQRDELVKAVEAAGGELPSWKF
ncbi:MAG: hypothetical protein AMXMBFR33_01340 [Candidatus Xenobia bacterium]